MIRNLLHWLWHRIEAPMPAPNAHLIGLPIDEG